jgi:hypothetical protein
VSGADPVRSRRPHRLPRSLWIMEEPGPRRRSRGPPHKRAKMRPGFTARLSEPPACSVFDPRPDAHDSIASRSPETPFGIRRVNAENAASIPASCRSRKLGTAFRSPVTTLSPPLRGQRSRPAPSFPRRCFFANPFDPRLLRSVRFRSRYRANSLPSTRCPRRSPALS